MEQEILYCIVGFIAGYLLRDNAARQQKRISVENPITVKNIYKLDKLLQNIESYDGTEKNQQQINREEE